MNFLYVCILIYLIFEGLDLSGNVKTSVTANGDASSVPNQNSLLDDIFDSPPPFASNVLVPPPATKSNTGNLLLFTYLFYLKLENYY